MLFVIHQSISLTQRNRLFFLYFICFWVFTVFISTQDTSQISTCINLHYTTLLPKENTTTLDYENKRKERKKEKKKKEASRIDINNKLVPREQMSDKATLHKTKGQKF